MRIAINKNKSKSKITNDDTIKQIDEWIATYQHSFISIYLRHNVEEVMDTGVVSPEEVSYRKEFKCKQWEGEGPTIDISQIVADFKNTSVDRIAKVVFATNLLLKPLSIIVAEYAGDESLLPRVTFRNQTSVWQAYVLGFFTAKRYTALFEQLKQTAEDDPLPAIELEDGNSYQIIREPTGERDIIENSYFQLKGILSLQDRCRGQDLHFPFPDYSKKEELRKKYPAANLTRGAIEIALDIASDDPIDSKLTKVWEITTRFKPNSDRRQIATELYDFRISEIQSSSFYLQAFYKNIYWSYSHIHILKGNPESVISHFTQGIDRSDLSRKLKDVPLKKNDQVFLLMPWENQGNLFSLDLTSDDTIVIGPRKELEPHVKRSGLFMFNQIYNVLGVDSRLTSDVISIVAGYACPIRTFYLESMSKQQIEFFEVTRGLRPTFFQSESEDEDPTECADDTALVAMSGGKQPTL